MKATDNTSTQPITKEEAIAVIQQLAEELGRPPKKSELPDEVSFRIKPLFGKWCYALEEADLRHPSEKVLEKRRKRDEHRAAVDRRRKKREAKKAAESSKSSE